MNVRVRAMELLEPRLCLSAVYWSTAGEEPVGSPNSVIRRADLDGSNVQTILTTPVSGRFGGVAVDEAGGHVYSGDGSFVFRTDLDGTNRVNLAPTSIVTDVELDLSGGKIYWASAGPTNRAIRRADLDGSNVEVIKLYSNFQLVEGIAVDPVAGKLFYAFPENSTGLGFIRVANLDGSSDGVFKSLGLFNNPFDVEIDSANEVVYWNTNGVSPGVYRTTADGAGPIETVVANVNGNGIDFDGIDQDVYYSNRFVPGVGAPLDMHRAAVDGSSDQVILTDIGRINYIDVLNEAEPPIQQVEIDVKPGSETNPINLNSNGVIAVAIKTDGEFDASLVDIGSLVFAGAMASHAALEDVDGDGDLDLVAHFRTQETDLRALYEQLLIDDVDEDGILDSTHQLASVRLTGTTTTDVAFEGLDEVDLFLAGRALRDFLESLFA